jgi:hypothetical protein
VVELLARDIEAASLRDPRQAAWRVSHCVRVTKAQRMLVLRRLPGKGETHLCF